MTKGEAWTLMLPKRISEWLEHRYGLAHLVRVQPRKMWHLEEWWIDLKNAQEKNQRKCTFVLDY